MDKEQVLRIIKQHGYEKILFATDSPWGSQSVEVEVVKKLGLPKKEEAAILGGNASRLLGLTCEYK
jgi:predicted TIM-barrel fold metal-dependent hydrolase